MAAVESLRGLLVHSFAYGAIGVFTLGVTLDYGLLAGATTLGAIAGVSRTWRSERIDAMSERAEVTQHEDVCRLPSSPVVRMRQNLVTRDL